MTERDQDLLRAINERLDRLMYRHTLTCVAAIYAQDTMGTSGISVDKARDFIRSVEPAIAARERDRWRG